MEIPFINKYFMVVYSFFLSDSCSTKQTLGTENLFAISTTLNY